MNRRILLVHNHYKIPGGEDTVVENEKRLMEEHGYRVILYTRHNKEIDGMSPGQKVKAALGFIYSFRTKREITEMIRRERADAVMVHNTLSLISSSVYDAALTCGVPVIQVVHNMRLLCPNALFYRDGQICEDCVRQGLHCALKHSCYRGSLWQTFICVAAMKFNRVRGIYGKLRYICLTEFSREKLLQLKQIRPEQVFIKPNFTDYAGEWIPFEKRKDRMIFAGRLDELKGLDAILTAWKLLKSSGQVPELLIAGSGPMEGRCRDYIKENGLDCVRMVGRKTQQEVLELVGDSKALLLPTRLYEGFPMTIAEAFAAGTPVIGSGFGNVGDLITEPGLGVKIEPPCGASELAEAVRKFQAEYSYDEEALRSAAKRYGSEENFRRLEEILGEIVSPGSSS